MLYKTTALDAPANTSAEQPTVGGSLSLGVVHNRHTTDNQFAETDVASLLGELDGTTPSTSMNATAQQKEVYTRPAVEPGTDTDSSEVNRGQNEGATATSRNSSLTSSGKDTNNSETEQEKVVSAIKSAEAEEDTNPSEGRKKSRDYKMELVTIDDSDITTENQIGSVRRQDAGTPPA